MFPRESNNSQATFWTAAKEKLAQGIAHAENINDLSVERRFAHFRTENPAQNWSTTGLIYIDGAREAAAMFTIPAIKLIEARGSASTRVFVRLGARGLSSSRSCFCGDEFAFIM